MPYRLNPEKPDCVQVKRGSGWERLKCHRSERMARDQLTALRIQGIEGVFEGTVREAAFDSKTPPVSQRGLGKTVNDRLMSANLRHRHTLLMVENGVASEVAKAYQEALDTIGGQLAKIAEREGALSDFGRIRRDKLLLLQTRIEEALQVADAAAQIAVTNGLERIIAGEVAFQKALLEKILPSGLGIDLVGPDDLILSQILSEPLGGVHYADRFRRNFGETTGAMRSSLGTSVALGEGMEEAARRLRKSVSNLSMNRAIRITRTEIQRAANRAAQHFYTANAGPTGVIKGIQIIETLDVRTCLICINQDGKFFPVEAPTGMLPPYHANCRGFITPVVKSFADLGIDAKEFGPSTRASMNGQVPDSVNYQDWFTSQPAAFQREVLGPTRFKLFKDQGLTFDQMVKNNRILPVSVLPSL